MEKKNMLQCFAAGDEVGGYCNGFFGRDDYENKICVLVRAQYAVFEYVEGGGATVLNFKQEDAKYYKSEDWAYEI